MSKKSKDPSKIDWSRAVNLADVYDVYWEILEKMMTLPPNKIVSHGDTVQSWAALDAYHKNNKLKIRTFTQDKKVNIVRKNAPWKL